jgi:hypothetical protein
LIYQLQDLFGPLKVQEIARSNKKLLEALANEPEEIRRHRSSLEEEQQDLQEALDKCKEQFGDINMYIVGNDKLFNSSSMQPVADVQTPQQSTVTPISASRHSNLSSVHSHASSMISAASASTAPTTPSPGGSPSERKVRKKRYIKLGSSGLVQGPTASEQSLQSQEEL